MACPHFMYKFFIIKVIRDIEKICSVESQNEEYAIMHSMNVFLYYYPTRNIHRMPLLEVRQTRGNVVQHFG